MLEDGWANKKIFDISPLVSEKLAIFPGDTPFRRHVQLDFKKDNNLVLSSLTMSSHVGAHVDAPNHYHPDGSGIESRGLRYYLGSCQVVSVEKKPGERIGVEDIGQISVRAPRVLFKTRSFLNPDRWTDTFNALSGSLVESLARKEVILVGIDTPSIDLSQDKVLESHQAVYKNNMAILEGVVLDEVPDGLYTLIALPLKIDGGDASPVRAILIDNIRDQAGIK